MASNQTTETAPAPQAEKMHTKDSASVSSSRSGARLPLPSLDQLAARVKPNVAAAPPSEGSTASSTSQRPRLAASLLARSSSSVTVTTLASSTSTAVSVDSLAVQAPTSRSGSPAQGDGSRPASPSGSASATGSDDAVVEKLDRLDLADRERVRVSRGYKNVPSLEAITERFRGKAAGASDRERADLTKEADVLEPVAPKAEHPLQNKWTLYYDTKAVKAATATTTPNVAEPPTPYIPHSTESGEYEAGLSVIGEFATVETFCRYFNWLKPPSKLERNSNYHLFKKGIKPMWEDPANANGGRWVLTMRNNAALLDRCWSWLVFGLVGEDLEDGDEICGAVVSLRAKQDRIQVWIRSKEDVERINSIGRKLVKLLDVSETDGIGFEFQYNTDDRPPPAKFLSIQAPYPQSGYRQNFHHHTASAGAGAPAFSPVSGPDSPNANGTFGPAPGSFAAQPMGSFGAFGGGWRGGRRGAPGVAVVKEEGGKE